MKTVIAYLEGENHAKYAGRICRLRISKTGKTFYYKDLEFVRIRGYKTNHLEINSGYEYWISNPKKMGNDTLYPGVVQIDEDVKEEYWINIRNQPQNKEKCSYRCSGKYSRRKPHSELNVHGNVKNGGSRSQQK